MTRQTRGEASIILRLALFATVLLGVLGAQAAYRSYIGPDGGYLNDAENWKDAPPFYSENPSDTMGFDRVFSSDAESRSKWYSVYLRENLETGAMGTANQWFLMNLDLKGCTLRSYSDFSISRKELSMAIANGTLALVHANNSTNKVAWTDANAFGASLSVTGATARLVGNVNVQKGSKHKFRLSDGARMFGYIWVSGDDNTVEVSGAGTVADFCSAYSLEKKSGGSDSNQAIQLGNAPDDGVLSTGARVVVSDGAVVTNVTLVRIGGSVNFNDHSKDRPSIGASLVVSNAYWAGSRTGSSNWIGGAPASCSNSFEIVAGSQAILGGSGDSKPLYVGYCGDDNLFLIKDRGTSVRMGLSKSRGDSENWADQDAPIVAGWHGQRNRILITDGAVADIGGIAAGGEVKRSADYVTTSLWNTVEISNGASLTTSYLCAGTRHTDDLGNAKAANLMKSLVASNEVRILNGGVVTNSSITYAGFLRPFFGNGIVVSGKGSRLVTTRVVVGQYGSCSNRLEVSDGGSLELPANGRILVGNEGTDNLGRGGTGNVFRVSNAGVSADYVYLGYNAMPDACNRIELAENAALTTTSSVVLYGFGNAIAARDSTLSVASSLQAGVSTGGSSDLSFVNSSVSVGNGFVLGTDGVSNAVNRLTLENSTMTVGGDFNVFSRDNELVISNSSLTVNGAFRSAYYSMGSGNRYVFAGKSPHFVANHASTVVWQQGCTARFEIPRGGYDTVPFTASNRSIKFEGATTSFEFDVEAFAESGGGDVVLMESPKGIDATDAQIQKLRESLPPKCKLRMSPGAMRWIDSTQMILHVPRKGMLILFR